MGRKSSGYGVQRTNEYPTRSRQDCTVWEGAHKASEYEEIREDI